MSFLITYIHQSHHCWSGFISLRLWRSLCDPAKSSSYRHQNPLRRQNFASSRLQSSSSIVWGGVRRHNNSLRALIVLLYRFGHCVVYLQRLVNICGIRITLAYCFMRRFCQNLTLHLLHVLFVGIFLVYLNCFCTGLYNADCEGWRSLKQPFKGLLLPCCYFKLINNYNYHEFAIFFIIVIDDVCYNRLFTPQYSLALNSQFFAYFKLFHLFSSGRTLFSSGRTNKTVLVLCSFDLEIWFVNTPI